MNAIKSFWMGLGRHARAGLVTGVLLIAVSMAAFAYWALRVDYGVLFSNLGEADLAAVSGELDKMKVPHRIGGDGRSVLVPEAAVHKTRIALMGRQLPLHGAVGFELFNHLEFGVSEFVQKVNYQRALQGELTRTILSIDELQSARVHLALPEQSLFRKDAGTAKASVIVTTKPGRMLQAEQVHGIQRLVAASVPDVRAQDVTVLDQHGVTLSRAVQADGAALDAGASQLDLKRGVESYLAHKAVRVLDRMFGAGESVVSVDAVFTQDQKRVTTEEVLAAGGSEPGQPSSGVVLRERQTVKETGSDAGQANAGGSVTSTETDYQTGKRTEQVVTPAGVLKQLSVAVVVKPALSEAELERVRKLVAASVGVNAARGDVVSVQSMQEMHDAVARPIATPAVAVAPGPAQVARPASPPSQDPRVMMAVVCALGTLGILVAWLAMKAARRRRAGTPVLLDDHQRARMLHNVQQWLAHESAVNQVQVPR